MKTLLTTLSLFLCSLTLAAQTPLIFSVNGAGTSANQGTFPTAINNVGELAGTYVDSSGFTHGFRSIGSDAFNTFSPFGATYSGVSGVNDSGFIVGWYSAPLNDPNGGGFGFIRNSAGIPVQIQAAPAGRESVTYANAINNSGSGIVVGSWLAATGGSNCFVRAINGAITTFTALTDQMDCDAVSINLSGEIAGYVSDSSNVYHGFFRDALGNITVFDPPGSVATFPYAINTSGQVAGIYENSANVYSAFLYTAGSFTTFSIPGSTLLFDGSAGYGYPISLNDSGEMAGVAVLTTSGNVVGWTRSSVGHIIEFSICGQTGITALNNAGKFTGYCGDESPVLNYEGFSF
jgi:hypothetical protein